MKFRSHFKMEFFCSDFILMMWHNKQFWIRVSLFNLLLAAIMGFLLRSKILFSIPFLDYRNLLTAHSHTAFTGWVEMGISILFAAFLYTGKAKDRLPLTLLILLQVSTIGMALSFFLAGYGPWGLGFSGLHIITSTGLALTFWPNRKNNLDPLVKLLARAALASLLLAQATYILMSFVHLTRWGGSVFYREVSYTYLHFLYNGFFTLSILTLFTQHLVKGGWELPKPYRNFIYCTLAGLIPSLALSLLWLKSPVYLALATSGGMLLLLSLFFLLRSLRTLVRGNLQVPFPTRWLWMLAGGSFFLKTAMQCGTLVPSLGHAIFSDRPVIIGFLHLVFLALVSFYLLGSYALQGTTDREGSSSSLPVKVFAAGVIATESLLMLQGLQILFRYNNDAYAWLLWVAAMLLLGGALLMVLMPPGRTKKSHQL